MSAVGGSVLVGGMLWGKELLNTWRPRRIGIYGASMVGKTTLDQWLTTPGEMEEIPDEGRTTHLKILGKFLMPRATRKRVVYKGDRRVVHSSDIGGEERFWNLWIEDMVNRNVEVVFYLFDKRATSGEDAVDQIGGFRYLVDCLIHRQYRYRKLRARIRGKKYLPKRLMLIANKADEFFDDDASVLWQQGRIGEHTTFDPFRPDLVRLQKAGIPLMRSFMATRIGWNVAETCFDALA
tara:strand:- start:548 stop:1258 length:711 start_codon:yes stop_codon:yes gene_type:complete